MKKRDKNKLQHGTVANSNDYYCSPFPKDVEFQIQIFYKLK